MNLSNAVPENSVPENSVADADEDRLLEFQQRYETAADRAAVLDECCTGTPHLAQRLKARAEMVEALTAAGPAADAAAPLQLGEFKIVRRLGVSMGEVFEAWQPSLKRRVAIKTIRRGRISPQARERFLREQQVLAGLHQTHIVPIHAGGEEGGLQYFVMPYIDGAALHHVVHTARALDTAHGAGKTPPLSKLAELAAGHHEPVAATPSPETQPFVTAAPTTLAPATGGPATLSLEYYRSAAQVMADAADALQHAHDAQILHRDVKPSNLMVDRRGHCWIIDFGLAGLLQRPIAAGADATSPASGSHGQPLTVSGIMGTPPYMAPEQWEGRADERTDIYGLGVTLFELVTLRRAFDGESHEEIKRQVQAAPQPRPRDLVASVPADLDAVCRKAMQADPAKRYASPAAFADDLRRWLSGQPTHARPAWWPRRLGMWARRNKGWAAALLFSVLALLAVTAGAVENNRLANERTRDLERDLLIQRVLNLRHDRNQQGWHPKAWSLIADAAKIRSTPDLDNAAGSLLYGLDARLFKQFPAFDASSVAFDGEGKRLLLGGSPGGGTPRSGVKLWDAATNQTVNSPRVSGAGLVAFALDGTPLELTTGDEGLLELWDTAKNAKLQTFGILEKGKPAAPAAWVHNKLNLPIWAMNQPAKLVAAAAVLGNGRTMVVVWSAATGKLLWQREFEARALAFSVRGVYVAAGDREGRIALWTALDGKPLPEMHGQRHDVHALAFSPDADRDPPHGPHGRLAVSGEGSMLALWDLPRRFSTPLRGSNHDVFAVAFNPDGTLLASGGRTPANLWDAATGHHLLRLKDSDFVTAMAFSPDGQRLAYSQQRLFSPGHALVWELEHGRGIRNLSGLTGQIARIQLSPDEKYVAALAHDWGLGIWELATGKLVHTFDNCRGYLADNAGLAFSHDNRRFAVATGQVAMMWDLDSGKVEKQWVLPFGMSDCLAFDPSGKRLLLYRSEVGPDSKHTGRGRDLLSAQGVTAHYESHAFPAGLYNAIRSHDGTTVVMEGGGPEGRAIQVIELATGKELWKRALPKKTVPFGGFLIDPESKYVAFADRDTGPTDIFELATGKPHGELDKDPMAFALAGNLWVTPGRNELNIPSGYVLIEGDSRAAAAPRLLLGMNLRPSGLLPHFNRAGTSLLWGNEDGTVTVCDLPEIRRRLAASGLGR